MLLFTLQTQVAGRKEIKINYSSKKFTLLKPGAMPFQSILPKKKRVTSPTHSNRSSQWTGCKGEQRAAFISLFIQQRLRSHLPVPGGTDREGSESSWQRADLSAAFAQTLIPTQHRDPAGE